MKKKQRSIRSSENAETMKKTFSEKLKKELKNPIWINKAFLQEN